LSRGRRRALAALPLLLVAAGCKRGAEQAADEAPPRHVGRAVCAECHAAEAAAWTGSDHDLAMEEVSDTSVLGDFGDVRFEHYGVVSRFFRRDGRFMVETDGEDGKLAEFEIAYTFGVRPLQQYLVRMSRGRLQALPLAWDARPAEAGGQRWFHLYPGEPIPAGDELHWTGRLQNWNFMCAECHSTGLRKGYDPERDAYETTWEELDVSCEACHGPGSTHVQRAREAERGERPGTQARTGLMVRLADEPDLRWDISPATGNASRHPPRTSRQQIEVCGRCHSRRSVTSDDYVHGRPLLDTHRVTLLEPGRYYPDGQILDEVYVYGSFLQSRMYAMGVTCTDCHDPHTLKPLAEGNALCNRCHLAARYDSPAHHFHPEESAGARCVECHMPARTYMVVDPRRDHSLRVPRPDLAVELGTPDACTGCHTDRSPRWAADVAARWWPDGRSGSPHWGPVLAAARRGAPGAGAAAARLATDAEAPGIVRATAAAALQAVPAPDAAGALGQALADPDPLVRLGALYGADGLAPPDRLRLVGPALADPIRTVRVEAARVAAGLRELMPAPQREQLAQVAEEFRKAQLANADRAEAWLNLGVLSLQLGEVERARDEYQKGLRLDPRFVPLWANLGDLHRTQGDDALAERVLREGLEAVPGSPALRHALGLTLVRRKRLEQALEELGAAARDSPGRPDFAWVYAIALESAGRPERALEVLGEANERHPDDAEILVALAVLNRDLGRRDAAIEWARRLAERRPEDPRGPGLLRELGGRGAAR